MKFIAHATENTENFVKMTTAKVDKISAVTTADNVTDVRGIYISDYGGTYVDLISELLEEGSKLNLATHGEHITHIVIHGEGPKPFIIERVVDPNNNVIVTASNNNDGGVHFGFQGVRGKMVELSHLPIEETFPFDTWECYDSNDPALIRVMDGTLCPYKMDGVFFVGYLENLVGTNHSEGIWRDHLLHVNHTMLPWETEGDYVAKVRGFSPQEYREYLQMVEMYKKHLSTILHKDTDVELEWAKVLSHVSKTIKQLNIDSSMQMIERIISDYFVVFRNGVSHGMSRVMLIERNK